MFSGADNVTVYFVFQLYGLSDVTRRAGGDVGGGSTDIEGVGRMIRRTVVCVASVPILAVAAIHQTIPGIMLAAFCGVCCYMMFVKPTPWQTTDMAYLASAVVLGVAFALIVEPLLVIPTVVMVCGAMAPNAYGNGKITHHPTQR